LDALKARQQRTWSSGDYAVIGTTLQITGERLCETIDIAAGELVVDVAAGNGNAALAAARRGAQVTACDYVGSLLDSTRARAAAEQVTIDVREADAEDLPFADGTFDVALSTFGVMFTPRQEVAATELLRVVRPGGRIGLANWTPDSFVGQVFKTVGRYVPPPEGGRSPLEWGTRVRLRELIGSRVRALDVHRRQFVFRYRSAQHWVDSFREFYGPTHMAFANLAADEQRSLERDLLALAVAHNTSVGGALRVPSDYLEVVAITAGERATTATSGSTP
jgi:SAM-dependent methyltransferase